jgi:hypothetical protein
MSRRGDPLDPHWEALAAADSADVGRRSLCEIDPQGRGYLIQFLNRPYLVNPSDRTIQPTDPNDEGRVNFEVGMVLLVYLAYATDTPLTGKWITEKNLPTGELFFRGLHALPTRNLAACFADRPQSLVEVAGRLGAREVLGPADVTVELRPLPRVPVRIQLWARDDEFDAHATVLFDASIEHQLALDAIGSMVSRLVKHLCRAVT